MGEVKLRIGGKSVTFTMAVFALCHSEGRGVYAKELKLAAIWENARLLAEDAVREQWGHLTFLRRLLEEETTRRSERSKITRIHRAEFPQMKYLEELQREELPLEGQMIFPEVEILDFIREGRSKVMHYLFICVHMLSVYVSFGNYTVFNQQICSTIQGIA